MQYSDEVQKVLDTQITNPSKEWRENNQRYFRLSDDVEGFDEFWDQLPETQGGVATWDAMIATQFKDQLDPEDYIALMTPWWKAVGRDEMSIRASSALARLSRGGYTGKPTHLVTGEKVTGVHASGGYVATYPFRFPVPKTYAPAKPPRRLMLEEAANLVDGDRNKHYGEPLENHQRIADLWAVVFGHKVTPAQVAIAMGLVKVARLVHTPDHHDSYVDASAYFAIADELTQYSE
jgi:hypothetical protein